MNELGEFGPVAAEVELLLVAADGTETPATLRVGIPRQEGPAWSCAAEIGGLEPRYPDLVGEHPIHALTLALGVLHSRLGALVADGGVVLEPVTREVVDLARTFTRPRGMPAPA